MMDARGELDGNTTGTGRMDDKMGRLVHDPGTRCCHGRHRRIEIARDDRKGQGAVTGTFEAGPQRRICPWCWCQQFDHSIAEQESRGDGVAERVDTEMVGRGAEYRGPATSRRLDVTEENGDMIEHGPSGCGANGPVGPHPSHRNADTCPRPMDLQMIAKFCDVCSCIAKCCPAKIEIWDFD